MVDKAKFQEEEEGYRIDVVGRNIEVTDPIRDYIWKKLDKVERFHNHIMHVHVSLEIQKLEHFCAILVKVDHTQIKAHAESTDLYASIDKAIDRLDALMSRYKSRIQDHHKRPLGVVVDMQVNVLQAPIDEVEEINDEIESANHKEGTAAFAMPQVIGSETRPLKTLTLDEALMKIDLLGDQFLLFRREDSQKLQVLYKRSDGNYGLIQPE